MNDELEVVILAAGKGTRLGRRLPKPLTRLRDGRSILRQQVDNLRGGLGAEVSITAVVGFQAEVIMAAAPDLRYAYNPDYDRTNTSKSLLRALLTSRSGGVLWLNGDVVFEPAILTFVRPWLDAGQSFVCVDTSSVGEEEVKYTLDQRGYVAELSKIVRNGLGEAVGINYVAASDKVTLVEHLHACADDDYFERGIETAIASGSMQVQAVDISAFAAVEVDFEADLRRANALELPSATSVHA
jgi:choline kinase